jgi:outer membrane protein TolC
LRWHIVRTGLLGCLALCAAAQQQPPLTLADCVRLATSAQSVAGIAHQQLEIAHYGIVQARAGFLPQVSVGNLLGYNSPLPYQPETFSYIASNGIREYSSLVTTAVELDTSGRLRAQFSRAKAEQDAAQANVKLSERDLKRAVSAAYYRLLLAQRLIEVSRDNLAEAQAFERRTRMLAEGMEVAQADVVKAAAQVAFFEQSLNAAELEAKLANHDLAAFWTTDVDAPLSLADELTGPVPVTDSNAPGAAPYMRRPEFNLLDAQKRGFEADAQRAMADRLPQLSFVTQYGFDSTRISMADRGYAGFVQLNIPVFDWFRSQSAAKQFQLQARQVDIQREIAARTFSKEYRDALARVDMIYSQIAISEKQVKLSEEDLRLARVRYEGGEGLALDVVTAQQQLAQARTNYLTARANYMIARVDLEVAAGQ